MEFENLIVSCLTLTCLILELKSEGLKIEYPKFDQPSNSEMTFKDVSGKLPSTTVLATW